MKLNLSTDNLMEKDFEEIAEKVKKVRIHMDKEGLNHVLSYHDSFIGHKRQ